MGGDRGPDEVVAGALAAAADGIVPVLVGPRGLDSHGLELIEAPDVIAMDEKRPRRSAPSRRAPWWSPAGRWARVARTPSSPRATPARCWRPRCSSCAAFQVCAGRRSRSPSLHVASHRAARLGCQRRCPARGPPPVRPHGRRLRAGDPRCRGSRDPLLSIGEEPEKGNQLTLEAHELLVASELNFAGNTEGRDLLDGAADVVVADGFTGNVALKLLEGRSRVCSTHSAKKSRRRRRASSAAC